MVRRGGDKKRPLRSLEAAMAGRYRCDRRLVLVGAAFLRRYDPVQVPGSALKPSQPVRQAPLAGVPHFRKRGTTIIAHLCGFAQEKIRVFSNTWNRVTPLLRRQQLPPGPAG